MEKTGVKAVLSNNAIINKWEEPYCNDLPGLVNSIKNVRQSINDFLTDLINKEKGDNNATTKPVENSDEEEDVEDAISGFIKETVVSEGRKINNKRKVHTGSELHDTKKKK